MDGKLFDPDIRAKAEKYYVRRRRVRAISAAYSLAFFTAVFVSPLARNLASAIGTSGLRLSAYLAVILTAYSAGQFILGYFFGYRIQKDFGLSTQSVGGWLADGLKSWILTMALAIPLLLGLHRVMFRSPDLWWLYAGLGFIGVTVVLANVAPVLIMPLFYRFTPLGDEELRERLQSLFDRTGTSIRGIFIMNMSSKTLAANAMITGTANTRRMILGDTLVDRFEPDEIEVVMAHELGHHHLRHLPKLLALNSLMGLAAFWVVSVIAPMIWLWLGYNTAGIPAAAGISDPAFLPVIPFLAGLLLTLVAPMENAFSRRLEYDSDQFALEVTGKHEAFARAMARLADQNLAILNPPRLDEWLWFDHPPIGKRIAHSEQYGLAHPE